MTNKRTDQELMDRMLGIAARCWCDPRASNTAMDSELATVFAEALYDLVMDIDG